MSKHTSGPWRVHRRHQGFTVRGRLDVAWCSPVSSSSGAFLDMDEAEANARLIAAAPALLAALDGALRVRDLWAPARGHAHDDFTPEHQEELRALTSMEQSFRAALAQAEGGGA